MTSIQQLDSTKNKVADMLRGNPELRDADPTILSIHYWKYYDDLDLTMWIPKLTNTETIRRARQLLAASNPNIYGPIIKEVKARRRIKEMEYHDNL